jgi:S-adenosylmethionine:tRNA ribosyltransferase-isomerase
MSDFDYELPDELIAQTPLPDRASSRLMVINRTGGEITHAGFSELGSFLRPDDLLVLNDSRVIPARLKIQRTSGGRGELLLLHRVPSDGEWIALARPGRKLQIGETVHVLPLDANAEMASATILDKQDNATAHVQLSEELDRDIAAFGLVPLPPYITTELHDPERYQTVYSHPAGSAAAPTAGLHFTNEMLSALDQQGVKTAYVTLHVGLDTFRPVSEEVAEEHEIHSEWCSVSPAAVEKIQVCRKNGGRVIAVGTTSARTLETLAKHGESGNLAAFSGPTNIFITPGYEWMVVDGLITNFHLPKSTLLLMVSSFASRDLILRAYREAIDHCYRFFSFGDATLIL